MSTFNLEQTIAEIQAVNRSAHAALTAPDEYPSRIAADALPLAATLPGGGRVTQGAVGLSREERTFLIDVYVRPLSHGVLGEGVVEAARILQAVRDAWTAELLNGAPSITDAEFIDEPLEDTGVVPVEFAGVAYLGFRLTLRMVAK